MKILHISSYDIYGGASRAAFRLHTGMRAIGIDSQMLVMNKRGGDAYVLGNDKNSGKIIAKMRQICDRIPLFFYKKRVHLPFSLNWLPGDISREINKLSPDITVFHWINDGFVNLKTLKKLQMPAVIMPHDSWFFTGGCHIHLECSGFKKNCGHCPQLGSRYVYDISRCIFNKKMKIFSGLKNIYTVTASDFMNDCLRHSPVFSRFKGQVIPNGLDISVFKPAEKKICRSILNLPADMKIILFGALNAQSDYNKGYDLLLDALKKIKINKKLMLCVFGASEPLYNPFPYPCRYFGQVHEDYTLTLLYNAADVMVVPSRQEGFGQTASEALACGTPAAAFNSTGLKDIIDHRQNGYLAAPFSTEDLAFGIKWLLENKQPLFLAKKARAKAEKEFSHITQAGRYMEFFKNILSSAGN
ncbi:MAG: hypothetical protein A2096_15035 [Spirochaetes bacterium GWF1_41_5]|nr:MAG: hypothetical protein A2096_15035 [Spirochaetes bacterium GWF1_41_5]HBE01809.1 glycosyl transferase [Spirochaetia bacterium]